MSIRVLTLLCGMLVASASCRSTSKLERRSAALREKVVSEVGLTVKTPWLEEKEGPYRYPNAITWSTRMENKAQLHVLVSTKDLALVQFSETRDRDLYGRQKGDRNVSEQEAISIAESWIRKWAPKGLSNLEFRKANYVEHDNDWSITWRRKEGAIRFQDDDTWVVVRASDGSVSNFRRDMYSAMPDNMTKTPFDRNLAIETARAATSLFWENTTKQRFSETSGTLEQTGVEILAVRPNSRSWLEKSGWEVSESNLRTRLAYVIGLQTTYPPIRPGERFLYCHVLTWLDYRTGEIFGGDHMAFYGVGGPALR